MSPKATPEKSDKTLKCVQAGKIKKKRRETFGVFFAKILKDRNPELNVTPEARGVFDSYIEKIYREVIYESSLMVKDREDPNITSREITTAIRLQLPAEMAKRPVSKVTEPAKECPKEDENITSS